MKHISCAALAACLSLAGMAQAASLPKASGSARLALSVTLEDLDPSDGVTPGITFLEGDSDSSRISGSLQAKKMGYDWCDRGGCVNIGFFDNMVSSNLTDGQAGINHAEGYVKAGVNGNEASALGPHVISAEAVATPTGEFAPSYILASAGVRAGEGTWNEGSFTLTPHTRATFSADIYLAVDLTDQRTELPWPEAPAAAWVQASLVIGQSYQEKTLSIISFKPDPSSWIYAPTGLTHDEYRGVLSGVLTNTGGTSLQGVLRAEAKVNASAGVVPASQGAPLAGVVPEPQGFLLAGAGLAVLGLARRRSKLAGCPKQRFPN